MQMRLIDIVRVFRAAIAGAAQITDHIPGLDDAALL